MSTSLYLLRTKIFSQIWSGHQPENLIENHKRLFLEGLSEIQANVVCEQERNANVVKFCNTHFKCGVTVLPAVRGVIKFLYTVPSNEWCCPIFYRQGTLKEVQCFSKRTWEEPDFGDAPALPLGFTPAHAGRDSTLGRANCGMFAIHDRNIWISPYIQSYENVVIEWAGRKSASQWTDEDPVSDEVDFARAVKLYLQYAHERFYGNPAKALFFKNRQRTGQFDDALSDLIVRCHEETRIRNDEVCRPCPCFIEPESEVLVGNVEVYWMCGEGTTMDVIGELPAWITFDEENMRLVGAAGEYQRSSQLEADAAAQAALDEIAEAMLVADALICAPPVGNDEVSFCCVCP